MSYVEVNLTAAQAVLYAGLVTLVFTAFVGTVEWLMNRRVPTESRPDRHIPPRERELLGDSWPEVAADYFADWGRRRQELHITRNESEGRAVLAADPHETHGGSRESRYGQ